MGLADYGPPDYIITTSPPLTRHINVTAATLLALASIAVCHSETVAQVGNLGLPFVRNFEKAEYGGGTQSWGFAQGRDGVLHVANNDGLLTFDGERWRTHALPNRTIARSVAIEPGGSSIYVGGQGIFGRFRRDLQTSALRFDTLSALLPADADDFDDVWHVAVEESPLYGASVFFQTTDAVYRYYTPAQRVEDAAVRPAPRARVERVALDGPALYLGSAGGEVYLHQFEWGLSVWRDGAFHRLAGSEALASCAVVGVDADERGVTYVTTLDCGLFGVEDGRLRPYPIAQQDYLLARRVQAAALLPDGTLALGTGREGLLLVDLAERRVRQHLTREAGLQNANVRACFADAAGDLWLGLDNGIDHVDAASPYRRLSPDGELGGATYAVQGFGDSLYVGTSNGLYVVAGRAYHDPLAPAPVFRLVAGSEGQVWGLDTVGGELLLGHHEGAFAVRGGRLERLSSELGYWRFLPRGRNAAVAGTYEGLRRLRRERRGEGWTVDTVNGFRESARILAPGLQEGEVWVAQPYKGLYRVRPGERDGRAEVAFYGAGEGLPADGGNHVFALRNEIVVGGQGGVYRYESAADAFAPHDGYTEALGARAQVVRLVAAPDGEGVYYVTDQDVGVLDVELEGLKPVVTRRSFGDIRPLLLGGFELVAPQPDGEVLVGAEEGLLSVALDEAGGPGPARLYIRSVGDVTGGGGESDVLHRAPSWGRWPNTNGGIRYPPHASGLRFTYAATAFGALDEVEYQTRLRGLGEDFSAWTTAAEREFTNLGHGDYHFEVRARLRGSHSAIPAEDGAGVAVLRFRIAPPWYATVLAKAIYVLLALLALAFAYTLPQRRYARRRAQLQSEAEAKARSFETAVEELESEKAERERTIEALKSEKLEVELRARQRELADATMHVVHKNELLQRLRENLEDLRERSSDAAVRKGLRQTVKLIADDEQGEDDWLRFIGHFDQVHQGFSKRLRERYPELTTKDHKLCAYLRMNLSTKEIAPLLNISVRGVEIGRYRLRKKLGLEKGQDLGKWIGEF